MMTKYFSYVCILLTTVLLLGSCDRSNDPEKNDPRAVFVGDYTFASTGDIDIYAGTIKVAALPMDQEGEMSISLAEKDNAVWIVAEGDSLLAYVSENRLFIDPTSEQRTFKNLVLDLSFTYSNVILQEDVLSMLMDVMVSATYEEYSLAGRGQVELVANKKK